MSSCPAQCPASSQPTASAASQHLSPPNAEPNSQIRAAKFSFTGQIQLQRPGHGHVGCVQKAPQAPAPCLGNGAGLVQRRRRRRLFSDGSICCKRSDCWKCCYYSTHGFSPPLPHCFPSCVLVPGGSPPHCSLVHQTPLRLQKPPKWGDPNSSLETGIRFGL